MSNCHPSQSSSVSTAAILNTNSLKHRMQQTSPQNALDDAVLPANLAVFEGLIRPPAEQAANEAEHDIDHANAEAGLAADEDDLPRRAKSNSGRLRLNSEELKAGSIAIANANLRKQIGGRLSEARKARGWSQVAASAMFGCASSAQVSLWEGAMRPIPLEQLVNAARVLDCSLDHLCGLTSDPDIDRVGAARTRIAAAVQRTIERTAEIVTEQVERHARLIGPNAGDVRELLVAGAALLDAVQTFIRRNQDAFEGQAGGATLVRTGLDFEDALLGAHKKLRLKGALDGDIRRALEALKVADAAPRAEAGDAIEHSGKAGSGAHSASTTISTYRNSSRKSTT